MNQFTVKPIGTVNINEEGMFIRLEPAYIPALRGLEGFSHISLLFWFDGCDTTEARGVLEAPSPYKAVSYTHLDVYKRQEKRLS